MSSIQISIYEFSLADKYHPGEVLGEPEAIVLNRCRMDSIRNVWAKEVGKEMEKLEDGGILTPETIHDLQVRLDTFASSFSFSFRPTPRPKIGTINTEARKIAEIWAIEEFQKAGKPAFGEVFERRISALQALPEVQKEARVKIQTGLQVAAEGLENLF